MPKFPNTIYVRREDDGEAGYFVAEADVPTLDATAPVAVYKLVEVGEVKVTREYAKKGARR